ncbi:MAG TPA: YbaB/EbfC family nucleoid-associated protein [Clostridiales bacterium]|nr:YbaB/EbfC family nucleoid-associated protein [Clostridiales bacterium]
MGYGFGGFGGGNMQQLMRQAQKMQQDMQRARAELDEREFTSSVGGGMVELTMLGNKTVKSLSIKPEVIDPDDKEMLEDLIVSAFNDVIAKIEIAEKETMPNMPGMM